MATIINPTPVAPSVFDGFWVHNLHVTLPRQGFNGSVVARLLPYDGEHLLATGGKDVREFNITASIRAQKPALDALLIALETELARLAPDSGALRSVTVQAPDPAKPVVAVAMFVDTTKQPLRIPDCFAKAGEDAAFAQAFNGVLGSVAALAGLTISQS